MPAKKRFDENPQFMNLKITESAANTYTEDSESTPVVTQLVDGNAQVIEILKIMTNLEAPDLLAATKSTSNMHISSKSETAIKYLEDSNVIIHEDRQVEAVGARTAEATGVTNCKHPAIYDFTDAEGNGLLFAGKKIYIGVTGVGCNNPMSARAKILYRLKKVSAAELLGIIQN